MTDHTSRKARIHAALTQQLAPVHLEIHDDSARHAHHASAKALDGATETHLNIAVTSARFDGLDRVARHRLVNTLLKPEFERGLHALSLVLKGTADI